MNNIVSLEYLDDYDIIKLQNLVKKQFEDLKIASLFKPNMRVLVKVCIPYAESPDSAKTCHPSIVRAVVNEITELGAVCVIADSPYKKFNSVNSDEVYLTTGMLEVANLTTSELSRDLRTQIIETPDGLKTKSIQVLKAVEECDVIVNIGKIMIDSRLGYYGSTANMFGIIPGEIKSVVLNRLDTLEDFNNYLLDIHNVYKDKIVLNVLDGIVALEYGDSQRMLSCLAMSADSLCLDSVVLDLLSIDKNNSILKQAEERGLFDNKQYRLIGNRIEKFKVEDFAVGDFNQNTKITKTDSEQKKYFKTHQRRTIISLHKCKGCGVCAKICPANAISMKKDKNGELFAEINYKKCVYCNKCFTACPYKVVEVVEPIGFKKIRKEIEKHNEE